MTSRGEKSEKSLTFFQRHFRANLLSLGKGQLVRSNISAHQGNLYEAMAASRRSDQIRRMDVERKGEVE